MPEIEDCVQDVVRRRFGGFGQRSQWLVAGSAKQRMDLEVGHGLRSDAGIEAAVLWTLGISWGWTSDI